MDDDLIEDGGYVRDCDLCLFDQHWCGTCHDIVGHGHFHY